MYNQPLPEKALTDVYFKRYAPVIKEMANKFLYHGGYSFTAGTEDKLKFKIKYEGKNRAIVGKFLKSLRKDKDLKVLLTGSLKEVRNKFGYLFNNPANNKRASGTKYPDAKDNEVKEDLNEIAYHIFVTVGYEKKLDKTALIKEKDLRICPYCGSTRISVRSKGNGSVVKPTIDHYLPKRKYPWLGMNYHNLVSACKDCNDNPNKHVNSPMTTDLKQTYLPHPYNFKDSDFSFRSFKLLPSMKREEKDMDIRIDYSNPGLKKGYNDVIAIETLYQTLDPEAYGIWQSMVRNTENYRRFSKYILDPKEKSEAFDSMLGSEVILNFKINEENSRTYQEYKFKKDLYEQFREDIFVKKVF